MKNLNSFTTSLRRFKGRKRMVSVKSWIR